MKPNRRVYKNNSYKLQTTINFYYVYTRVCRAWIFSYGVLKMINALFHQPCTLEIQRESIV